MQRVSVHLSPRVHRGAGVGAEEAATSKGRKEIPGNGSRVEVGAGGRGHRQGTEAVGGRRAANSWKALRFDSSEMRKVTGAEPRGQKAGLGVEVGGRGSGTRPPLPAPLSQRTTK